MSLLPGLSYIYRRFLKSSIPKNSLDRLPNDIIVDGIFDYLDVDDIICVRMVSLSSFACARFRCNMTRESRTYHRVSARGALVTRIAS